MSEPEELPSFASRLIAWQRIHGRHDLPWQRPDAYWVWLSEIMLQQTQVATVIPYFQRFIASFPNVAALAAASEEAVLSHWSGLGYYARGRNLHRAAQIIVARHGGVFPAEYEQILALPGIGRSTAAAICSLAYQQRRAILDGNVRRVLARHRGIEGTPAVKSVENRLWQIAESLLPAADAGRYTQALMDMGATLCTRSRPGCQVCPVAVDCVALQSGRVDELPTPKLRRVVPERRAVFMLALVQGEVLLEKRDSSGLWGGLLCLPQFDEEWQADSLIWEIRERVDMPVFTHTFTHFRLHISPLLLRLNEKPCATRGGLWLKLEDALSAAIPTPVRRLLEQV